MSSMTVLEIKKQLRSKGVEFKSTERKPELLKKLAEANKDAIKSKTTKTTKTTKLAKTTKSVKPIRINQKEQSGMDKILNYSAHWWSHNGSIDDKPVDPGSYSVEMILKENPKYGKKIIALNKFIVTLDSQQHLLMEKFTLVKHQPYIDYIKEKLNIKCEPLYAASRQRFYLDFLASPSVSKKLLNWKYIKNKTLAYEYYDGSKIVTTRACQDGTSLTEDIIIDGNGASYIDHGTRAGPSTKERMKSTRDYHFDLIHPKIGKLTAKEKKDVALCSIYSLNYDDDTNYISELLKFFQGK